MEHIGRGKLFQRHAYEYEEENFEIVLEELLKAIPVLVKKKIGALIVLERKTGLKEFSETGIKIEGLVTAELLINIFMPRSPLHDGAVIIRDLILSAASCYLPLTENPNLSKELGTRHRAGWGLPRYQMPWSLSYRRDGLSPCHDGKLTRYLDEKTLRSTLLNQYFSASKQKRQVIPAIFTRRFNQHNAEEEE